MRPHLVLGVSLLSSALACSLLCVAQELQSASNASRKNPAPVAGADAVEFTPVPLVGGNSDVGFGGGFILSYAKKRAGYSQFIHRLELFSLTTFKSEEQELIVPYQDHYVLLTFPHVIKERLQLQLRASFTRESTLKYYGLGNQSQLPAGALLTDDRFAYDRIHPELRVLLLHALTKHLLLDLRINYTYNSVAIEPESLLAEDMHSESTLVNQLAGDPQELDEHSVLSLSYGLQWDDRDDPVATTSGQWHTARLDWAPGGTGAVPYDFSRLNTTVRFYLPLPRPAPMFATRLVGDFLFGNAPIYELARFNDTSALGGLEGVRGVPGQRYHGKAKLFGSVELRQPLFNFYFLGKTNVVGLVAFSDAGRLWTDYQSTPEFDGATLGLKYGLGGGLRIFAGTSFVLRGDVAWSPDARPVGAYFSSGNVF